MPLLADRLNLLMFLQKNLIMKTLVLITFFSLMTTFSNCQTDKNIRLLVRADDIGSFHAANIGCIKSYREGIARSVEIMVPCPWYPEAVKMLNENPGYDVGVHLVMTSEWENMKWRPLTGISSITDEDGYFYPMVWPNEDFPPSEAFRESGWHFKDVENELRAQIELAKKDIKSLTHITTHMGFTSADPEIEALVDRLAEEYDLDIDLSEMDVKRLSFKRDRTADFDAQEEAFAEALAKLEPGTYLYVEHPAMNFRELESIGHRTYKEVGYDREGVTRLFTSEKVLEVIRKKNIELISYGDLKR